MGILLLGSLSGSKPEEAPGSRIGIRGMAPGWTLRQVNQMPERINSLATGTPESGPSSGLVFAGTSPMGGVYCVNPLTPSIVSTVANGMGDRLGFGVCHVTRIAVADLDRDGRHELLATTSQVHPRGRPRLYSWSLEFTKSKILGIARPQIQSHWSHGLSFATGPDGLGRAFATFCGHGEIVEYRMAGHTSESGFVTEGLSWKQVGQLPASGEWTQSADVDNDGVAELCFATGFRPGAAAIVIYRPGPDGQELIPERVIDEGKRFGNVRFLVGPLGEAGEQEMIAWWCTDHVYGGDCEVIRYRVGPEGIVSRRELAKGAARSLWPDDGQFALADLDVDGRTEVWFASRAGDLWRCDGSGSGVPFRVLKIDGGIGALAAGNATHAPRPTLYLSSGRTLLRLDRDGPDVRRAPPSRWARLGP